MPNRTRAGKCINAVSAAANEFGMMKKGKPKKNTALQIEAAVAGLCKGKLYPRKPPADIKPADLHRPPP